MWIMFNDGFLSVVNKSEVNGCLIVRARRAEHIKAVFPEARVRRTSGTDYGYRADIPRDVVADVAAERIRQIAYSNFKDSVSDDDLHDAYTRVWSVMGRLQPGGPYSSGLSAPMASIWQDPERNDPFFDGGDEGLEPA